ncbi:MAG: preprotein translocase subunit SecG [Patescibacteria group bacterium]|jgi:preprotein translocase subunit SecG
MLIKILSVVEIVTAVLMTIAILMQAKGAGLGAVFGGEGNVYRTKRGAEKVLFYATIVMGVIFAGAAIAILVFQTKTV